MMRLRSMCSVLLLALAGSACGSSLDSTADSERSVISDETMRLVVSRTTVTERTLLPLTVTLTNTGSQVMSFEENTCPFSVFEVEDADGVRIDPKIELILCAAYTRTLRLQPGQSYTWSLEWPAARYAPSRQNPPAGAREVRMRARYWVDGKALVAGNWQSITVTPAP